MAKSYAIWSARLLLISMGLLSPFALHAGKTTATTYATQTELDKTNAALAQEIKDRQYADKALEDKINALPPLSSQATPPAFYEVGDTGPAGGTVVYLVGEGAIGVHGLEVAPTDVAIDNVSAWAWGCQGQSISGADSPKIGKGKKSTSEILTACNEANIAAEIADGYQLTTTGVTYDDWWLPSIEEMRLVSAKVNFSANALYWTSTRILPGTTGNNDFAVMYWSYGGSSGSFYQTYRTDMGKVRPIRFF